MPFSLFHATTRVDIYSHLSLIGVTIFNLSLAIFAHTKVSYILSSFYISIEVLAKKMATSLDTTTVAIEEDVRIRTWIYVQAQIAQLTVR